MLHRMPKERLTVSMDPEVAARVRQCGVRIRGGSSAYLERLVQQDALREAVREHGTWFRSNPHFIEQSLEETAAAFEAERST